MKLKHTRNKQKQNCISPKVQQTKSQLSDGDHEIDKALRTTAPLNICTTPPAELHAGIMQAVHRSATPHRTILFPLITSIAASFLIICYVTINTHSRTQQNQISSMVTKSISRCDSQINNAVSNIPGMLDAPMQQELDAFKNDIQNTTAYLLACIE